MAFDLSDYVDVAERQGQFLDRYPEGSLQAELTPFLHEGFLIGWLCKAFAYRTPDDPRPGVGHAYYAVPGKTPYTKDSEAMNAETAAWGRALVAVGLRTKKIASRQEVEAGQDSGAGTPGRTAAKGRAKPEAKKAVARPPADDDGPPPVFATDDQRRELFDLKDAMGLPDKRFREILQEHSGQQTTAQIPIEKFPEVKAALVLEAAPFE